MRGSSQLSSGSSQLSSARALLCVSTLNPESKTCPSKQCKQSRGHPLETEPAPIISRGGQVLGKEKGHSQEESLAATSSISGHRQSPPCRREVKGAVAYGEYSFFKPA